jgi:hypothetical protein
MRYTLLPILLLVLSTPLLAQDAKVMPLKDKDSAQAELLYMRMKDAEKAWADFQGQVKVEYLTVGNDDPDKGNTEVYSTASSGFLTSTVTIGCGNQIALSNPPQYPECSKPTKEQLESEAHDRAERDKKRRWYRSGWETAQFEFSKDFEFIVPKPAEPVTRQVCYPNLGVSW